jgi:hypothetical protein
MHDDENTRFGLLYVGGDGSWGVLSREPMLASRIWRRLAPAIVSGSLAGAFVLDVDDGQPQEFDLRLQIDPLPRASSKDTGTPDRATARSGVPVAGPTSVHPPPGRACRIQPAGPLQPLHRQGRHRGRRDHRRVGELATELHRVRSTARTTPEAALRALADAYPGFAASRPALYDAMFVQPVDITFGTGESPATLRAAFGEFLAALEPLAGDRNLETLAEVLWSALHGLATLTHGHRLRPDHHQARLDLLIDHFGQHPN